VYAVSAEAAGKLVLSLLQKEILRTEMASVIDLDEEAFRQNRIKTRYYGDLLIPSSLVYMQSIKNSTPISEMNVLMDIADDVIESMENGIYYAIGSGTTCAAIMDELGLKNTLLGTDIIYNKKLYMNDTIENDFLDLIKRKQPLLFVLGIIGGQGHIFGRGNQQITSQIIRLVGWASFKIIATFSKIKALNKRPLQVDTGNSDLDHQLFGMKSITIGYHETIIYNVGFEHND
jgi:predicted polyphosphate/ATP-dependent NAD kinase